MNKRGFTTILHFILIDVAIIILMATVLYFFVEGVLNDDNYWKTYYAKDTGLLLDVMTGEGDLRVEYGVWQGKRLLEFDFLETHVNAYIYRADVPKENRPAAKQIWGKPGSLDFERATLIPTVFYFEKKASSIYVNETGTSLDFCPFVNTKEHLGLKKIYFEAFSEEAEPIAERLKARMVQQNTNKREAHVIISLGFTQENNILRIRYSSTNLQKNQKMACLIRNSFAKAFPTYFDAVIVEAGGVENALENSLRIEMGSAKLLDDEQSRIMSFANLIYGGIYEYYE